MEDNYSLVIKELINTKESYLKDIESEILLIGEYSELCSAKSIRQDENQTDKSVHITELKLQMIKIYESYCADIDIELDFIADFLLQRETIEKLERTIEDEIKSENRWKKQYDDLANSKLGKIQRFWWRIIKKFRKG